MASEINFQDPKYYENRELSWLKFDYRILYEARDKENPLFERLKFLSITASNLDEFFHGPRGILKGYGTRQISQKRYCRYDTTRTA